MESRVLLSVDPALAGAEVDPAMRAAARTYGTETAKFLAKVQTWIYDTALGYQLPLIGAPFKGLKGTSVDLLQPLINKVGALNIQNEDFSLNGMQAGLEGALAQPAQPAAPGAAAVAPAALGNEFNVRIVDPNPWSMGKPILDVAFDMRLRGALVNQTFHPNFNLGLPVLGLKLDGGLNVSLTYDIHLIVGMDSHGLYLNTSPTGAEPEVKLEFAITAQPGLVFEGTLGFLRIKSVDAGTAADPGTGLSAGLFIDLQDGPDADTKLRWSEVPQLGLNIVKEVAVQGNAHVNMLTTLDLGSANFPALSSNFVLDWNFPRTNLLDPAFSLSKLGLQAPLVEFKNVTLDAGSFMSRFLSPVLKTVNDVLDPIRPVVHALQTRVPLLTDIGSLRGEFDLDAPGQPGYGEVSVLELLRKLMPGDDFIKFFVAVETLDNLVGRGSATLPSANAQLNFGTFRISGDPRTMLPAELRDPNIINYILPNLPTLPFEMASVIDKLKNPANFGAGPSGFKFPILDNPQSLFGLLLGQPVNLVTYVTPALQIGPTFERWINVLGPLAVRLAGGVRLNAQFAFGFDTFGLQSFAADGFRDWAKIFDGFYVSDTARADGTGPDVDELVVDAAVEADFGLNLGVASAYVGGGINGTFRLNLNDPNHDGKVRPSELFAMIKDGRFDCIFDSTGVVTAELNAAANLLFIHTEFHLAKFKILDLSYHCLLPGVPARPDLVGSDLTVTIPNPNDPRVRNYSLEVANRGTATSGASTARIYLSDDDQITTSDTPLATVLLPSLAQAGTAGFTGQFTLPNNPFGTDNQYFIGLMVDAANQVAESDETNNTNFGEGTSPMAFAVESDLPSPSPTSASLVAVNATTLPYDTPTDASLTDELIGPSDVDVFKFQIIFGRPRLFGIDVDTRFGINTYLRLYDANWNLIDENDEGRAPAEGVSAGGESYLEHTLLPGTYYAVVSAAGNHSSDPRLLGGRSAPAVARGPYVITLLSDPHALPDLIPNGFTATGTWTPSSNFRYVTLNIANDGTADSAGFLVQYFISDDANITTADTVVGASVVGGIRAGDSADVEEAIDLGLLFGTQDPLRTDNEYYLGVIVNTDPSRGVVEAATYNNSNRGLGIDSLRIASEADLPSPADGTVVARPIPANRFGEDRVSEIGDEFIGGYDLDVWSFTVTDPNTFARIYVRGQSTFLAAPLADPYLRLYDANWTPLAANDDGVPPTPPGSPVGSFIEQVFARAGTYYAVVGTPANAGADPRTLAGRSAGPKGGYNIHLTLSNFEVGPLDLRAQSFTSASAPSSPVQDVTTVLVNGTFDANLFDVNYYLSDDPTITTGDVLLKSTHFTGLLNELRTVTERLTLPADLMSRDNQYYVGVLVDPDNHVATAFQSFLSFPVVADAHLPSPADGTSAVATRLGFDAPQASALGTDEIAGPFDVDTFSFTAAAGQTVGLDVDSARLDLIERFDRFLLDRREEWTMEQLDEAVTVANFRNLSRQFGRELPFTLREVTAAGDLNAFVRLYDSRWTLLAGNDDRRGADDALVLRDPYLTYTFAAPGTYYAVVSASDSAGNDPRGLAGREAGSTKGDYALTVHDLGGLSIVGSVFDDVNADGAGGRDEPGLAGVPVYLDANNNGVLDPGETSTLTDADGLWAIGDLAAGEYRVRQVPPDGFLATAPAGGVAAVSVGEGQRPKPVHFGDTRVATLAGTSFHDLNADGRRLRNEPGNAGRQVFADLNGNGVLDPGEPRALTDENGSFELKVPTGRYAVREAVPAGWRGTAPEGGVYEVGVEGGMVRADLLFGSVETASVSGQAFHDYNGDGLWDGGEPALRGQIIFVDSNGNGSADPGEPVAVTGPDGEYRFDDLLPGRYDVAQALGRDWWSTAPAGASYRLELAGGEGARGTLFGSRYAPAAVAARNVFYNNSSFDGNSAAANAADDGAVATDKAALLPGQTTAGAQHFTNYTRGINGVMIDVARLVAGALLTADDFVFMTGESADRALWQPAPAPSSITVRRGAGAGGSDRITVTFPDASVRNTWLHVTLKANQRTGLRNPERFAFGNLVADIGDGTTTARVNALDLAAVKRGLNGTALVTSRVDFNRDGRINALDLAACKSNLNRGLVLTNLLAAVPLAALAADLSPAGSSATAVTRSLLGERA